MIDREELEELLSYFEDKEMLKDNEKITKLLIKQGIKLREYRWRELEAS
jgi:hypothetical protein